MCGITGYLNFKGIDKNIDILNSMTDALIHRGPDDRGIFIDDFVALGHRRLSIIDIKNGKQPMTDIDKSIFVVFNGEIYNFKELRKELQGYGYKFITKSDTEVIVYGYKHWGDNFVDKLNGMFVIGIYDKNKKVFLLYRDRIGIKPIYYTLFKDTFIFSSEPKSLFFFPIKKKLNIKVLSSYLSTHKINLGEETLFEDIFLLSPSTYLKIDINGISRKKYWEINFYDEDKGEEFYLEKVRNLVEMSTELRLISDVSLGSYLSGGVDSSILVSIITEKINKNLKTFSIGFDKDSFNEFFYSDIINSQYNISHKNIIFNENDFFNINKSLIKFKDFPLNVPNEVLIFNLSNELKKDITVVLSGEGADEIFGGYGLFLRSVHDYCKIFILNKCPDFFKEDVTKFMKDSLYRLYKNIEFKSLENFLYNIYSVFSFEEKENFFCENIVKELDNDNFIKSDFKKVLDKSKKESLYDKFLYFLEFYHLEGLLLRLDNATMAASVEGRVPYVDHKLVEFCYNIPFKYKIKWKSEENQIDAILENANNISDKFDISKYILRKTFKDKLPDEIYNRNKFSFPVPLNDWFNEDYKDYIKEFFNNKDSYFYDIFKYSNIINFINEPVYGKNGLKIWMMINIKMWIDEFF